MRDMLTYMNSYGNRIYNKYQVSAIQNAIYKEYTYRKLKSIKIETRTKEGRDLLNKEIANIANSILGGNQLKPYDIWVFKKCRELEYQDRTGKCAWGYKELRKRLGYDPNTGVEIDS